MTKKEKQIQKTLGTLLALNHSVKIKIDLEEMTRKGALKKSREIVKFLRKHFPDYIFKKSIMKTVSKST